VQAVSEAWVNYFKTSNGKSPFKVYVKTRWHSRYDQVVCMLLNWDSISKFVAYVEKIILKDDDSQGSFKNLVKAFKTINQKTLEHLIFFCKLTKPIRELIKKFEIRKYSTISFLIFGIQKAIHYISEIPVQENEGTNVQMKKDLISNLETRFKITDINSLALSLDPFTFNEKIVDDDNNQYQKEWQQIKDESLVLLQDELERRYPMTMAIQSETTSQSQSNQPLKSIKYGKNQLDVSFLMESVVVQPKKN